METKILTFYIRKAKSRQQLRMERRLRLAENIVTILLGLASSVALFWCGWLVGSGAVGI